MFSTHGIILALTTQYTLATMEHFFLKYFQSAVLESAVVEPVDSESQL